MLWEKSGSWGAKSTRRIIRHHSDYLPLRVESSWSGGHDRRGGFYAVEQSSLSEHIEFAL